MRTGYNLIRDDAQLLEEHAKSPPSFSIHLYPDHWLLNNVSKFVYGHQVSVRDQLFYRVIERP